jgi:hypothetical protein
MVVYKPQKCETYGVSATTCSQPSLKVQVGDERKSSRGSVRHPSYLGKTCYLYPCDSVRQEASASPGDGHEEMKLDS